MKIETVQKFEHRIKILRRMKDDYLFIRDRVIECEKTVPASLELSISSDYCDDCIRLLDIIIKSYIRKIERS